MATTVAKVLLLLLFALALQAFGGRCDVRNGTADGMEEWGYIDVRPGAHLFWWLYYNNDDHLSSSPPTTTTTAYSPAVPLVLWLQGGPGASGAGFGNFEEVGPLFTNLTERSSTWVQLAHLLFVDNPVGTGFSYVDDSDLLTTTNKQVSDDLIAFLKAFFKAHEALKSAPFYIVAESYGGKFASEVGVAIYKTIAAGELSSNFQGVALGDTWISPMDFLYAWGPLLKSVSLVDEVGNDYLNGIAELAAVEMANGHYTNATYIWGDMEEAVLNLTDDVDFYNFLRHDSDDDASSVSSSGLKGIGARHLKRYQADSLVSVMNGPIREKLGIIPSSVSWSESSSEVFTALVADFMLDTIDKVDELLALGINLTIYSGQLDLICCTTGTEAWVQKLKWLGLSKFNAAKRTPLYCAEGTTEAFVKKSDNLAFYWVLNAGHMVPTDNPCGALKVLGLITEQTTTERNSVDWIVLDEGIGASSI